MALLWWIGNPVELTFKAPSGLDGIATAITDSQGRFRFDAIPVGKVDFTLPGSKSMAWPRFIRH
jgi:protocatechuate 3,4-dioxygenase beta subunit